MHGLAKLQPFLVKSSQRAAVCGMHVLGLLASPLPANLRPEDAVPAPSFAGNVLAASVGPIVAGGQSAASALAAPFS